MKRKICLLMTMLMVSGMVFGCGTTQDFSVQESNGDASSLGEIQLCVRENGSGTRAEFEDELNIDMVKFGEDLYESMEQAFIAEGGSEVAPYISENVNAIGYASLWQAGEDNQLVAVDGIVCSRESIEEGAYPLTRPLSVAWMDTENVLRDDFIRYINGQGQEIVGEKYVPLHKPSSFLYDQDAKGELTIAGSSTVAPLMEELAAEYMSLNKNATITIVVSDSTRGLNDMLQGKYDLAMISRNLADYEKELVKISTFAKDGIAIVVNQDNPVRSLSKDQLAEIFSGGQSDWSAIK